MKVPRVTCRKREMDERDDDENGDTNGILGQTDTGRVSGRWKHLRKQRTQMMDAGGRARDSVRVINKMQRGRIR